ncbi:hypothetical protein FRC11_008512 [Ceratobasidium sp. 423]|nr:hypothetical protein FRC11_008512 [Ceratobasidium sp. 423]
MIINPGLKFEWINRCWVAYDRDRAYGTVQETIQVHNISAVEFELNQYIAHGIIPIESTGVVDLIEKWGFTYPLLYQIATDLLLVQTSSVSSERVFSSSKMACTAERNRLSVRMMEALQVLKHALKHHRRESSEETLDLVSHLFETLELDD